MLVDPAFCDLVHNIGVASLGADEKVRGLCVCTSVGRAMGVWPLVALAAVVHVPLVSDRDAGCVCVGGGEREGEGGPEVSRYLDPPPMPVTVAS